jgi:hypothetical protein
MLEFGLPVIKSFRRDAGAFEFGAQMSLADAAEVPRPDRATLLAHRLEKVPDAPGSILAVEVGERQPRRANRLANGPRLRGAAEASKLPNERPNRRAWHLVILAICNGIDDEPRKPGLVVPIGRGRVETDETPSIAVLSVLSVLSERVSDFFFSAADRI